MTLLYIPTGITTWRETLFALDDPVELSETQFDEIWPHVDNIWVYHQQSTRADGTVVTKYHCRGRRQRKAQRKVDDPKKRRNRLVRDSECSTAMHKEVKDGVVRLRRGEHPHAHSLDRSDQIKKCSYLRQTGQTLAIYEEMNKMSAREKTDLTFNKVQQVLEASYDRIHKEVALLRPDEEEAVDGLMNIWVDRLIAQINGHLKISGSTLLASVPVTNTEAKG